MVIEDGIFNLNPHNWELIKNGIFIPNDWELNVVHPWGTDSPTWRVVVVIKSMRYLGIADEESILGYLLNFNGISSVEDVLSDSSRQR